MSESLIFAQKTSDSLGKPMSEFPALNAGDNLRGLEKNSSTKVR